MYKLTKHLILSCNPHALAPQDSCSTACQQMLTPYPSSPLKCVKCRSHQLLWHYSSRIYSCKIMLHTLLNVIDILTDVRDVCACSEQLTYLMCARAYLDVHAYTSDMRVHTAPFHTYPVTQPAVLKNLTSFWDLCGVFFCHACTAQRVAVEWSIPQLVLQVFSSAFSYTLEFSGLNLHPVEQT